MEPKNPEYTLTRERVEFGMKHKPQPDRALRQELNRRMKKNGVSPYLLLQFPIEEITKILYNHPNLNKIHSISLDALECLPWRPDIAYDRWWVAFEVLLHEYDRTIWHNSGSSKRTIDLFCRFCNEVVLPELKDDEKLNQNFFKWMDSIPLSVCRYGVVRMLLDREIKVDSQYDFVRERAIKILGESLYDAFKKEYLTIEDGKQTLNEHNHYRSANKLNRIITGKKITFQDKEVKGIVYAKSIEFVLSCILYASRCERLHGDYFSPFYSDKIKFSLYAHWYWMADMVYFLFILLFKRRVDYIDTNPISSEMLSDYLSILTNNFNIIFS